MKPNITAEQVRLVLTAFAEEFLVDVPAIWDKDNVATVEFTVLSHSLINGEGEWYTDIAEYVNATN